MTMAGERLLTINLQILVDKGREVINITNLQILVNKGRERLLT